jgi:sec-independent protein translocase protein TatB
MFDLDVGKALVVAVVALVVVGPKDLPRALASVARIVASVRRAALLLRSRAKEMIDEVDLDGMKKEFAAIDRSAAAFAFDPKTAMRGHLPESAVALGDAPPAAAEVAQESYASPEMRDYLSPSPPSGLAPDRVSPPEHAPAASPPDLGRTPGPERMTAS